MTIPSPGDFVPFSRAAIGDEEIAEVVGTLRSGWLTTGPRTKAFETAFSAYTGAAHALAVNSCTAALHLALVASGIGPGDEVITTPLTFCATVNVILEAGATPVLADIGWDLNIAPDAIEAAITPRTRAVVPVHYGGLPCDMDSIWSIAERRGLKVIEDAAHAAGASYGPEGPSVGGSRSDAVAFSFYATKNLCTGEGGMVTTGSADLAARMKVLALHGISRDAWNRYSAEGSWYYEVEALGYKYNMSDVLAALGVTQLPKLDRMNARRAEIARLYNGAFADITALEVPPNRAGCRHAWHLYALRLNLDQLSIDRARFIDEMKARGIGCSVHFIPIPLHPHYRKNLDMRDPCARALAEYPRLVSLPLFSDMTDAEAQRVIDAVTDVVRRNPPEGTRRNRRRQSGTSEAVRAV